MVTRRRPAAPPADAPEAPRPKRVSRRAPAAGPSLALLPAEPAGRAIATPAARSATLTLSSKNYSSWSLRGWLLARFAGLDFEEEMLSTDNADVRAEILLLAPSMLVPCLHHGSGPAEVRVWDTLAIGEYLHELFPEAGLLPTARAARAHCRAICGEMHSGFSALRSALPMNLKARFPGFKVWSRAQADIDRIVQIWTECFDAYGGPWLFGAHRCMADAMYAPVVTRLHTYDVRLSDRRLIEYCQRVLAMPEMQAWIADARLEPEDIDELEAEF
ncbi:glutathione S-transferase family protein [Piscinibacter sp. Jin2]|uniref:Glutathione S-transferase family protein n=1 Tax=Aquariibacter lacus TaxID=2801332 RepID=A0A9X1BRC2_9BURK|nr:glutathione S-transferase family protein [Piscinibacter lacus]MBL0719779.1 glutathione S-transferase family protein [Piscinibacter lacus]